MKFSVPGKHVLVTGAAAGMGLLYAKHAVQAGAAVVTLIDRNPAGLAAAAQELGELQGKSSVKINQYVIDLVNLAEIDEQLGILLAKSPVPDLVINNAGIVSGNAYFWDTDMVNHNLPTFAVNVLAAMQLTRILLPAMMAKPNAPEQRILNIASAAGLLSNPRMSVYAASKWAMLGWSDSVRLELEQTGHKNIKITTFCPSYVKTGMFNGAKGMFLTPLLEPEKAVTKAWRAMLVGKAIQVAPSAVNLARILKAILPQKLWDKTANLMGVYKSMSDFTGRQ